MVNYPNMQPEILEAIHGYFENQPEIEIDCLLYLTSLRDSQLRTNNLAIEIDEKLKDMGRCIYCGSLLQYYSYKEPHPELDNCPVEDITESYCPNCDFPHQTTLY